MAQGTDYFKLTIQNYLDARAREDELFAPRYANPKKNIDDCCTFIINQVRQSGCNGFADEEIYSMALHYYDEEDIDIGKPVSCKVVVNHTVELTEEEKAEARRNAIRKAESEAYAKLAKAKSKPKKIEDGGTRTASSISDAARRKDLSPAPSAATRGRAKTENSRTIC